MFCAITLKSFCNPYRSVLRKFTAGLGGCLAAFQRLADLAEAWNISWSIGIQRMYINGFHGSLYITCISARVMKNHVQAASRVELIIAHSRLLVYCVDRSILRFTFKCKMDLIQFTIANRVDLVQVFVEKQTMSTQPRWTSCRPHASTVLSCSPTASATRQQRPATCRCHRCTPAGPNPHWIAPVFAELRIARCKCAS